MFLKQCDQCPFLPSHCLHLTLLPTTTTSLPVKFHYLLTLQCCPDVLFGVHFTDLVPIFLALIISVASHNTHMLLVLCVPFLIVVVFPFILYVFTRINELFRHKRQDFQTFYQKLVGVHELAILQVPFVSISRARRLQ